MHFARLFVSLPAEIKLYDYECSINEQSLGLYPGTFADCQQSQMAGRVDRTTPPVLHTLEEALSDLDESEKEFERGDVLTDEEFNTKCQALIDSFAV